MGSRDLWIDFRFKFSAVSLTCVEVNNFWTSRFWLQIHLVVQMGSLILRYLGLTHFCFHWTEAMLWSWLMQVFFSWKRMGLTKTALEGKRDISSNFLRYFVIGHGPIWTINLVGIVGWFSRSLCWVFWETTIYHSEVCIRSKSNLFQLCTLTNW